MRPSALHFIGFRSNEYRSALRVFGPPDVAHIGCNTWARQEALPGDAAVLARGTFDGAPSQFSFPDIKEGRSSLLPCQAGCMSQRVQFASDG
jgi:hypothetical protein